MDVTKFDKVVLQGTRDTMKGLWILPLQILDRNTHQINNTHQVNDKENTIKYLHAAAFSPVQDTHKKTVKYGYFNTWPGIMAKEIN